MGLRGGCIAASYFAQKLPSDLLLSFLPLEEIRNPLLTSLLEYILVTIKLVLTALGDFLFL